MRQIMLIVVLILGLAPSAALCAEPLDIIVVVENSEGIVKGAPVRSRGVQIGEVTSVGFGEGEIVEIALQIKEEFAGRVLTESTFLISHDEDKAWVEHYILDAASEPAPQGTRFQSARSEAEIWLRRGRISSEEMRESLSKSVDELNEEIERLRTSEDWAAMRDELAQLAAEFAASGEEVSRMLDRSLPEIQRELDTFYQRYREEIEKRRATSPPDQS